MRFAPTLKAIGGLLLAVALLAWVLRDQDAAELRARLAQASIGLLVVAASLNVAHNVFRAWRWADLLRPIRDRLPFRAVFDPVIVGYLVTFLVPGRLGEFVRPAMLAGRHEVPLAPCLGTVVADRLLDGVAVVVLFGAGVAAGPAFGDPALRATLGGSALGALVVAIVGLAVLVALSAAGDGLQRRLGDRRGVGAWIARAVLGAARGVEALRRPWLAVRVTATTLAAWATISLATWVGLLGAGVRVPYAAVLTILPLLVLGIALPTPGGVGGYHAAMTFGLTRLWGVEPTAAVGASLLVHATVVLPIVLLGSAILVIDRVPLVDLLRAARQAKSMGGVPAVASGGESAP